MFKYVDNDVVLGNLFIKVIEHRIQEITFNKIYDFLYFTSLKLNEKEHTMILVSKDEIMSFVERYKEFIQVNEEEDAIRIMNTEASVTCFKKRYEENGEEYAEAFEYAMSQLAA